MENGTRTRSEEREEKPREWKTIKVTEETYEELKKMGKGIGKAVEILVEGQKKAFEEKLEDVEGIAEDIAAVLFESGIFDIRFKGFGVDDITEEGTMIHVRGFIDIDIPNAEAREQIIAIVKGEENVASEEASE